ncbi:alpha-amylase [Prevotella intermedia]|uniref:Alpha-amylase n=1 Tax=Prevotella intermedia TaxID=28131 RepID=A0AAD1BGU2_PREIN|nr:alpha-amylase family protein [Prevotella intermedia]AFJ08120.1 alpha amylase, catalytic domain protein [Prevotella intermedia 17]APW34213.1 alpha-amylase [Prevotella intermedia]BAR96132.1 alpha-amylase [Prevotella intermedia]
MKLVIYQVFTRTFGNKNNNRKPNGTLAENGVGKMNDFDVATLQQIKSLGINTIWYTGVIRHATCTDYSAFGIPRQTPRVVKGKAGSPYAITDYYDIDPDIADNVAERMSEFEDLVKRTHKEGLKVIIDFVPNHVAREYKSICKPKGVKDLGETDDTGKHFDANNNFYYCPNESLDISAIPLPNGIEADNSNEMAAEYTETVARCTGNDRFDAHPQANDWYETVKLNYGVDYCDWGGRSTHFEPIPDTWHKMTDILLFWAAKGIDGFRCDMAEMVPHEFWQYATEKVKAQYPHIVFIGEVYDPNQYRTYVAAGFDYLYDKVGMYDCLRDVMCGHRSTSNISQQWQAIDDIREHILYFLENHDEQRIASDFFCGNMQKGIPALIVSALFQRNPMMIYAGQEFGERGMDGEGFSGVDGRSTIFDYWSVDAIRKGVFERSELSAEQLQLEKDYRTILNICNSEKAVSEGKTFDLMYANEANEDFDSNKMFAFLRSFGNTTLLVVANFGEAEAHVRVNIPAHAFDYMELTEGKKDMVDLLSGDQQMAILQQDSPVEMVVAGLSGRIYKF